MASTVRSTPALGSTTSGEIFGLGFLVEIFERFAAVLLVLREIVVAAMGDAFEFLDAEGKFVFEVVGALRVKRAVLVGDGEDVDFGARDADGFVPGEAFLEPLFEPLGAGAGLDEELDFHLLEFARAEGEVARVDFVAEGLADLRDAEGKFFLRDIEHVLELDEHGLRGFGAEVGDGGVVFDRADVGLEHKVEGARLGKLRAVLGVEGGGILELLLFCLS